MTPVMRRSIPSDDRRQLDPDPEEDDAQGDQPADVESGNGARRARTGPTEGVGCRGESPEGERRSEG